VGSDQVPWGFIQSVWPVRPAEGFWAFSAEACGAAHCRGHSAELSSPWAMHLTRICISGT